jgi:hypothetical protein
MPANGRRPVAAVSYQQLRSTELAKTVSNPVPRERVTAKGQDCAQGRPPSILNEDHRAERVMEHDTGESPFPLRILSFVAPSEFRVQPSLDRLWSSPAATGQDRHRESDRSVAWMQFCTPALRGLVQNPYVPE